MKIDPLSKQRASPARRNGTTKPAASGDFAKQIDGEAPSAAAVSGATGLGPVDALLALQEVPDSLARHAKARQRGETLLDQLDQIRLALLAGTLSRATLGRLVDLLALERPQVDDPRLAQIIDEIELRAAVELAKLEH